MNQVKITLGTFSVLLILIAGLGPNSRAVQSAESESSLAPGPCRDINGKKAKVWPTLRAQPRNGQYRLIQVNWDVDEVLDGDWLGVFSDDPNTIPSEDLDFVPQTTPVADVTTSGDNGGATSETLEARPSVGSGIRKLNPRKGMEIDVQTAITNEIKVGWDPSLSNSTLDSNQNETMHEVTEQPLHVHRKVHQRNRTILKGRRRKARNKTGRKSHHKRKFRNRQLNESVMRNNSNSSSEKYVKITNARNRNAVNSYADKHVDDQSGSWRPVEPSLLTTPVQDAISYFDDPKSYLEHKHPQKTKAHNGDQLGDKTFLIEHSSTIRILQSTDNEEKELREEVASNEDYSESSEQWKPMNSALYSRVLREAEPRDEVIIITDKDEESRFGGGFYAGSENDKSILSTDAEEEHRFGGGFEVNGDVGKEHITFITDPNEENRFGGGLGIIPDYSFEDTDEISLSDNKEEQSELDFLEPTVQTPMEAYSEVAEEVGVGVFQNGVTIANETLPVSTFETALTTPKPELSTEVSVSATETNESEVPAQSAVPNADVNDSQSSKIQSQAKGHRSKAERTGMNGDFFRGLQDSANNDFSGIVTVNNDTVIGTSPALNEAHSYSERTQGNENKKPDERKKKIKKQKFRNTSEEKNLSSANARNKSKVNLQKMTRKPVVEQNKNKTAGVKPVVASEEKTEHEMVHSQIDSTQTEDSGKTMKSTDKKFLPLDSAVKMENSDKNEVYFPIDLTVKTGHSASKNEPQEHYLHGSGNETSSVKLERDTRVADLEDILTTGSIQTKAHMESSRRRGRQRLENPVTHERPSSKGSNLDGPTYSYGQQDLPHADNEHHSLTDHKENNKNDYRRKNEDAYDEPQRDSDDFYRKDFKFPRKSRHFGGDPYYEDYGHYDYQKDYDPYYDNHKFYSSGYRSHETHGHHKELQDDPYVSSYHDIYDDYPDYQKYEDDYYDEYYATGSEPAKDEIITNNGDTSGSVSSVLRDDGNSTTIMPEPNVEVTESPYLDDVKIGDDIFLTDLRIDSRNITKNLTNASDFILITNGTNENEITIIASDLNDGSNSIVRVVTSFSDTTNTSTIVMSTNDDRDPSKVVISGLHVRPSGILITGGSHSPSIVVKSPRSVTDLSHSGIHFKQVKESLLNDILDYSMILRWHPVENATNFKYEVPDIASLFKINKEFHRSLKNNMEFDFVSYENRIARADKFRTLMKQKPLRKSTPARNDRYSFTTNERLIQGSKSSSQKAVISIKDDRPVREAHIDSSETNFDFDDEVGEDVDGLNEQSPKDLQPKVKYRQNSKILDYPTEDAKAPFIIEKLKNVEKIPSIQSEMLVKNGKPIISRTENSEIKSTHSLHPVKRRFEVSSETKTGIQKVKLIRKEKPTTTSILIVSSEADQIVTSTRPTDYLEEMFPSITSKNLELSTENSSNSTGQLDNEFFKEELKITPPLKQELPEVPTNRTSRMHEGHAEPGVRWSQYHPLVKFSALPTSTSGKITSTVQHPRIQSSQLSEGGCVGDWVAYIRRGAVIASTCIEAHPAWMWDHRDVLIDRPLEDLALLGTHNAGSLKTTDSFDAVEAWVVCQDETILDQLLYGVRHLDIRIGYYPDTPEKLWINHDVVRWAPFSTLLDDVLHFTKLSPDLVVLDIHRTPVGFEDPQATVEVLDAIQSKLGDLLYPYPSDSTRQSVLSEAHDSNWNLTRRTTERGIAAKSRVTLGDIWTAGRSVIVCWGDRGMRLNNPWLWPSINQEWADAQLKSDLMSFLKATAHSHRNASGFWALMSQLTPSLWDVVLRGSVGIRGFTDRVAASVDEWLETSEWLESGSIIATDFFHSTKLVSTIIDINIARASCPDLLHERVLKGRTQRMLSERVINQWKFSITNDGIFVESADGVNFDVQNEGLTTQSPDVEVDAVSAPEDDIDTTTTTATDLLQLSVVYD